MEMALWASCNAIGTSGASCLRVSRFQLHPVLGTRYFTRMQVTPTSVSHLHTSAPSTPIVLCLPIASALKPPPGNTRMAPRSERTCVRYRRNDGGVRAFFSAQKRVGEG